MLSEHICLCDIRSTDKYKKYIYKRKKERNKTLKRNDKITTLILFCVCAVLFFEKYCYYCSGKQVISVSDQRSMIKF